MVLIKRLALILILSWALQLAAQGEDSASGVGDIPAFSPQEEAPTAADSLGFAFEDQVLQQPDPFADLSRADVIAHIDTIREMDFPNARLFDPMQYPNITTSYRLSNDFTGLQYDPMQVQSWGFMIPLTFYQNWLYLGYLSQFQDLEQEGSAIAAHQHVYDYPVSLSHLEGSLGDYDSRYAQGSFAKGDLFGWEGVSMQFDYRLFNGYWVDSANSGNSVKQYIRYRYQDLILSFDLASYQREGGSYELNPAYWHLGNFRVKNQYSQLVAQIDHPWLTLSLGSFKDRISSTSFLQSWRTKSLQISAERAFVLPFSELNLAYEYRDISQDYTPASAYNHDLYEQKSSLSFTHSSFVDLQLAAQGLDWKRMNTWAELSKKLSLFRLGVYSRMNRGQRDAVSEITSPIDASLIPAVDIFSPQENALFAAVEYAGLQLRLALGRKTEQQASALQDLNAELMILRMSGGYDKYFGDWRIKVDSGWNYREHDPALMAAPEFTFFSEQRLYHYLEYDNILEAGFSLQGHSDYYLANAVNPYLIEASTMLDAWAGVRISKLFDFNVTAKNILSTSLHGLYPIPLSFHANLRWFFIN